MKITTISDGISITSTGTSVSAQIPNDSSGGKPRRIRVTAANPAYVKVGVASDITATAGDILVQPGDAIELNVGGCAGIAVKSVTGSATVNVKATEHGPWNYVSGDNAIDAVSILRRYGTNAHVYLPGIGTINGLTAGNYLLSDGSTGATPVDGLMGLMLDGAGTSSVVVNTGAQTVGVVGSGGMAIYASVPVVTGRAYQFTYTVTACVGQLSASIGTVVNGAAQAINWTGTYSETLFATSTATLNVGLVARGAGITSCTGSVTVTEITGTHATASGAARPTLRLTNGKYSAQYSGAQSLALGSVPFQMADDHAVIAGALCDSATGVKIVYSGYGAASQRCGQLYWTGGILTAGWVDDSVFTTVVSEPISSVNSTVVASLRKVSNNKILRKNGAQQGVNTAAMGVTTLTAAALGSHQVTPANFMTGSIGPVIAIKGTVTDADLLTLERFVSSMTPNGPSF